RRAGHQIPVHPHVLLPARVAAQLVGQRRVRGLCRREMVGRGDRLSRRPSHGRTARPRCRPSPRHPPKGHRLRDAAERLPTPPLQRVTDYGTPQNDFAPSRFVSRHDAVTEAVGYGKTAMVWNMLREKVGDAQFAQALRLFYRDNLFREASFDDIRRSFEAVSGLDLRPFFDQWIKNTGAPELELDSATAHGDRLDITLSQAQRGRLFALDVPVVIETDKGVETRTVSMTPDRARVEASFGLTGAARRVEIDPQFQVYR